MNRDHETKEELIIDEAEIPDYPCSPYFEDKEFAIDPPPLPDPSDTEGADDPTYPVGPSK